MLAHLQRPKWSINSSEKEAKLGHKMLFMKCMHMQLCHITAENNTEMKMSVKKSRHWNAIHYSPSLWVLFSFLIQVMYVMLLKLSSAPCQCWDLSAQSPAHDWVLSATFWDVWVTSAQFLVDITGPLVTLPPRKRSKTERVLGMCPVMDQVYLISESKQ